MAWIADVVDGDTIPASWGNAIRNAVVSVHASAAARTSAITAPTSGMVAYRTDAKTLECHNGSGWVPSQSNYVSGAIRFANSAGVTTTETQIDVFTTTLIAGRRYRVMWDGILSNSASGNNMEVRLRYASGASVSSAGTLIRGKLHTSPGVNINIPVTVVGTISSLPAGQVTIGAFLLTTFGAGTSTSSAAAGYATEMWIEDIGT